METQHFRSKRWIRMIQVTGGTFAIMIGILNLASEVRSVFGLVAIGLGVWTLGQGFYSEIAYDDDNLYIRRNFWKPKVIPWDDIDYAMPSDPLVIKKLDGHMVRLLPFIEDSQELRDVIDDTVGPPPG